MVKVLQKMVRKISKKQQRDDVVKITRIAFTVRAAKAPQIKVCSRTAIDMMPQPKK